MNRDLSTIKTIIRYFIDILLRFSLYADVRKYPETLIDF